MRASASAETATGHDTACSVAQNRGSAGNTTTSAASNPAGTATGAAQTSCG